MSDLFDRSHIDDAGRRNRELWDDEPEPERKIDPSMQYGGYSTLTVLKHVLIGWALVIGGVLFIAAIWGR